MVAETWLYTLASLALVSLLSFIGIVLLSLRRPFDDLVPAMLAATRGVALPVEHRHALQVARLPLHHHDPFDRMLIAQAQVEGLTILTADPQFRRYDVEVLAA